MSLLLWWLSGASGTVKSTQQKQRSAGHGSVSVSGAVRSRQVRQSSKAHGENSITGRAQSRQIHQHTQSTGTAAEIITGSVHSRQSAQQGRARGSVQVYLTGYVRIPEPIHGRVRSQQVQQGVTRARGTVELSGRVQSRRIQAVVPVGNPVVTVEIEPIPRPDEVQIRPILVQSISRQVEQHTRISAVASLSGAVTVQSVKQRTASTGTVTAPPKPDYSRNAAIALAMLMAAQDDHARIYR